MSGKLFGDIGQYCEHGAKENYGPNDGETIVSIQEDLYNENSLLAAIRQDKVIRPHTSLFRLHKNGTRDFLAGSALKLPRRTLYMFSVLSSVLQLNDSFTLIADQGYQCILSLNTLTQELRTFSGICSDYYKYAMTTITGGGKDGDYYNGTYTTPSSITKSPFDSDKFLVTDYNKIRELDISGRRLITTVYHRNTTKFKITDILWKDGIYWVASNEGVHKYDRNWKFQGHLTRKKVLYADAIEYTVARDFEVIDVTHNIIAVPFTYYVQYRTVQESRFVTGVFSTHVDSAIAMLYDNSSSDSLLKGHYPRSLTKLADHKLAFVGQGGVVCPAHCSCIKTMELGGKMLF